jgi:hypothetical protein
VSQDTAVPGTDTLTTAFWVLVAHAGHLGCGGWTCTGRDGLLRCVCGAALYEVHAIDRRPSDAPASSDAPAQEGLRRIAQPSVIPVDPPSGPISRPERGLCHHALRVPCPWCKAAPGQPCTVAGLGIPLKSAPAHRARLVAAGLSETKEADRAVKFDDHPDPRKAGTRHGR